MISQPFLDLLHAVDHFEGPDAAHDLDLALVDKELSLGVGRVGLAGFVAHGVDDNLDLGECVRLVLNHQVGREGPVLHPLVVGDTEGEVVKVLRLGRMGLLDVDDDEIGDLGKVLRHSSELSQGRHERLSRAAAEVDH